MNFVCAGHGAPTVVFEQGSGENILDWRKVRAPIAAITRTCFYDRAGFGYSPPSGRPTTALNVTDDLYNLLRAAKVEKPLVLVGHSLGGLFGTLYADRYPSDVAGLVLVDSSFAGQFNYTLSASGKQAVETDEDSYFEQLRRCAALARKEELTSENAHGCFEVDRGMPRDESMYLTYQYTHPAYYEAQLSESKNFLPGKSWSSEDGNEEKQYLRGFGAMPLEVLTRGLPQSNPRKSAADNVSFEKSWRLGHEKLAARSTRGEMRVVAYAAHNIQFDRPDAVIDAVRKVVLELRKPQGH